MWFASHTLNYKMCLVSWHTFYVSHYFTQISHGYRTTAPDKHIILTVNYEFTRQIYNYTLY